MTAQPITVLEKRIGGGGSQEVHINTKWGVSLVVNEQGDLVGILTGRGISPGDCSKPSALMYHAEEIQRYRASHIFEDIVSDQTSSLLRYKVQAHDFKSGGAASSKLKRALERLGGYPRYRPSSGDFSL